MNERLLILETSTRVGQVAIAGGDEILSVRRLDETRRHARDLAPAVAELLGEQGWKPRDINAVIVSRGPGSYTGLRVGIMSAKIFAYATGCGLIAVDSFAAVALQADTAGAPLDVIADAQQDKLYVQRFIQAELGLPGRAMSKLEIREFSDWIQTPDPPVWVSGPGMHRFAERLPGSFKVVDPKQWDPRAESLLKIGLGRFRIGERDDPLAVEPLYLRPSNAEENWKKGKPKKK